MIKKIATDEVQFEKDLEELKQYWETLNLVYYPALTRLHYLKHNNPYFISQMMYGINVAIDSILSAYKTDSEIYLCKHCKQLYVEDFLCLNGDGKTPCEPMNEIYNKDMTFEDVYSKKDSENE